jgi:hypothetical protein
MYRIGSTKQLGRKMTNDYISNDVFNALIYQFQRSKAMANGTSTIVPMMMPTWSINPQKTPAYFLKATGQILKAMIKDASR